MVDVTRLRQKVRKGLRLETFKAVLGRADGIVTVAGREGYVYIRRQAVSGLGAPLAVRMRAQMKVAPGKAVICGYDRDGELAVIEADFAAVTASGGNPVEDNAGETAVYGYTDMSKATLLLSHVYPGSSYRVAVKSWFYVWAGVAYEFPGVAGGVDLQPSIPAVAGEHCLAGLFVDLDTQAVEVSTSASQDTLDDLDITDVNECIAGLSATNWVPIAFWRLRHGMSAVANSDLWRDGRQWVNLP